MNRPYVIASATMSVDARLDNDSPSRLLLSGPRDLDRVDEVRANVDAILVGARTIRCDDPRLLVRSKWRREQRTRSGRTEHPAKVTITAHGELDPEAAFFTAGTVERLVYAASPALATARANAGGCAQVIDGGNPIRVGWLLEDLFARGLRRLLVEGGTRVHTEFLTAGLVDELHLVVAPFFVGDADAPRFVSAGRFPYDAARPMQLLDVRRLDDDVLMRYRLETTDDD